MKLKIKNFMGIPRLDQKFDKPINIFLGHNAQGKTSIAEAIRFVLGKSVPRNLKRKDQAVLFRDKKAQVDLQCADNWGAKRTEKSRQGVAPLPPELLESDYLLDLSPEKIGTCLKAFCDISDDQKSLKETLASQGFDQSRLDQLDFSTSKKAVESAVTRRRECRASDLYEEPDVDDIPEDINDQLTKTHKLIAKMEKTKGLPFHQSRLLDAEETIKELGSIVWTEEKEEEYRNAMIEREECGRQLDITVGALRVEESMKTVARKSLSEKEGIKAFDNCPTCKQPLNEECLQSLLDEPRKKLEEAENRVRKVVQEKEETDNKLTHAAKKFRRIREEKLKAVEEAEAEEAAEKLRTKIQKMEKFLKDHNGEELKKRFDTLNEQKIRMAEYDLIYRQNKAIEQKNDLMEEEHEAWDEIAKAIPKAEAELTSKGMSPLHDRMQKTQQLIDAQITIDEQFNITVNGRPLCLLSTSEYYLAGVIFYDALLYSAGCKIMLLDKLEALDKASKVRLIKTLLKLRGDYDTICLFGVLHGVTGETEQMNGKLRTFVDKWLVENGTVRLCDEPKKEEA